MSQQHCSPVFALTRSKVRSWTQLGISTPRLNFCTSCLACKMIPGARSLSLLFPSLLRVESSHEKIKHGFWMHHILVDSDARITQCSCIILGKKIELMLLSFELPLVVTLQGIRFWNCLSRSPFRVACTYVSIGSHQKHQPS